MHLSGRNVVVTGGTSGIGRALVTEFARRDNAVLTCGRDPERLSSLRDDLHGVEAVAIDLAMPTGVAELTARIQSRFDVLDVLVNNAGVTGAFDLDDPEAAAAEAAALLAVNVVAPTQLVARCMPLLRRSREAAIVNVTSIVAHVPKARAPIYAASKSALRTFTVALRARLEGSTVRVFDALPPLVDTAMAGPIRSSKMAPADFALIVTTAMERDRLDIRVGRNRWIVHLSRFSPRLAHRLIS